VGIIIDAAGNDKYMSSGNVPCFGAGILGWGIVMDLGGSDSFVTDGCYSQGCGLAGVGILYAGGGSTTFRALGGAQGYGYFGIGLLVDVSGGNTFDSYVYSQGCGGPMGFGLLCDPGGNDTYTANDTELLYPSAQTKQHNTSMCQGAGYGERRDYLDAHPLSGGIGMLLDGGGGNSFYGGVFAQAVGYWYGIGILDARGSKNNYRSVWYGQSATAHFAVSYLVDGGGSHFTSTNCVTVGAAHDFSVSLFVAEGGGNLFEGAGSMGEALNNSVALCLNVGGGNTYRGGLFGQSVNFSATGLRAEVPTMALFLVLDGNNNYPAGSPAGANRTWTQPTKTPLPLLRGAGIDAEHGSLIWD